MFTCQYFAALLEFTMPLTPAPLVELAVSAELGFVASPCVAPTEWPPKSPDPPIKQ